MAQPSHGLCVAACANAIDAASSRVDGEPAGTTALPVPAIRITNTTEAMNPAFLRRFLLPVGFDNERGKGHHCPIGDSEHLDRFSTPVQLIEDFLSEVDRCSSAH